MTVWSSPRDVLVTGMGFCLPGGAAPDGSAGAPVFTAGELWNAVSRNRTCLTGGDFRFGAVGLTATQFEDRLPDVPGIFAQHFTPVHRFGLVSLVEACADAKLDLRGGDLAAAAVLAGRGGIDDNVAAYRALTDADPATITRDGAMDLFVGGELGVTPSDVAVVQGAYTRTTGPCFTVSCGCASSAVQLQNAALMIAAGQVDIAVVTGTDTFDLELIRTSRRLLDVLQQGGHPEGAPELPPSFQGLMRPYDHRAGSINFGEGSATLVLESRAHAERRGAHAYGRVLGHGMTRDGLPHPLASDASGVGLVDAIRRCLGDRDAREVPYVHGGSDGDQLVTDFEAAAVRELWGDAGLLLSSHEGCFGHNGAPAGAIGVGLTLLMMERGEVCPTTNCEQPADGLPFDPVPGPRTRPLDLDLALSLSYQIGGVKTAVLLGRPD